MERGRRTMCIMYIYLTLIDNTCSMFVMTRVRLWNIIEAIKLVRKGYNICIQKHTQYTYYIISQFNYYCLIIVIVIMILVMYFFHLHYCFNTLYILYLAVTLIHYPLHIYLCHTPPLRQPSIFHQLIVIVISVFLIVFT